MQQHKSDGTLRILADPGFRELTSARAKLRWSLSVVTLIMFFGFIVVISTARCVGHDDPGQRHPGRPRPDFGGDRASRHADGNLRAAVQLPLR